MSIRFIADCKCDKCRTEKNYYEFQNTKISDPLIERIVNSGWVFLDGKFLCNECANQERQDLTTNAFINTLPKPGKVEIYPNPQTV